VLRVLGVVAFTLSGVSPGADNQLLGRCEPVFDRPMEGFSGGTLCDVARENCVEDIKVSVDLTNGSFRWFFQMVSANTRSPLIGTPVRP
jgi:hypothetical protein